MSEWGRKRVIFCIVSGLKCSLFKNKEDNEMKKEKKVKMGIAKKLLVMILPVAAVVMAGIIFITTPG